jgi:hypothetical protein
MVVSGRSPDPAHPPAMGPWALRDAARDKLRLPDLGDGHRGQGNLGNRLTELCTNRHAAPPSGPPGGTQRAC